MEGKSSQSALPSAIGRRPLGTGLALRFACGCRLPRLHHVAGQGETPGNRRRHRRQKSRNLVGERPVVRLAGAGKRHGRLGISPAYLFLANQGQHVLRAPRLVGICGSRRLEVTSSRGLKIRISGVSIAGPTLGYWLAEAFDTKLLPQMRIGGDLGAAVERNDLT